MLKLCEVTKDYKNNRGIKGINMILENGKLYLFIGENGSGKSTTIKLISRVIFSNSKQGVIENSFKRIVYLPDKRGYPSFITTMTFLYYYLGKSKQSLIKEYLNKYKLPNKSINSLSKGMLQKLGLIQVLLDDGDLFLFDEPLDGLDEEAISLFKEDINKLINDNKTVVISTHKKNIFKDCSPIIYMFKEGVCSEKNKRNS